MDLAGARADLAALARAAVTDGVSVIDHLADSVTPPVVLVGWGQPWIAPATLSDTWTVTANLHVIAGRIDHAGQLAQLETITAALLDALEPTGWTTGEIPQPFTTQIGTVTMFAATITTTTLL